MIGYADLGPKISGGTPMYTIQFLISPEDGSMVWNTGNYGQFPQHGLKEAQRANRSPATADMFGKTNVTRAS